MLGQGLYSPRTAARIARVRPQNFQAWIRASLLEPRLRTVSKDRREGVYTYRDLLLMRLIMRLRAAGAKTKAIGTALRTIAVVNDGDPDAWMRARLYVDAGVVAVIFPDRPEWSPMAASQGPQKMALVFFPQLLKELEEELVPPGRFPHVEVDLAVLGGAPVVRGTRISTRAVASTYESGQDPVEVYPALTQEQAENARAFEEFLSAA